MLRRLLNKRQISRLLHCDSKQLNEYMKREDFPFQIVLSERYRGWDEDEIQDWIVKQLEKRN